MTTARTIITRSLRLLKVASPNRLPTTDELDTCLEGLNDLLFSYFGNGIGPALSQRFVSTSFSAENGGEYIVDTSLGAVTATLPAVAQNGARVGFVDGRNSFATHALSIAPNGHVLAGATGSVSLSANGATVRYFFRSTTGWEQERALEIDDDLYLDEDLTEPFVAVLAARVWPEYGADTDFSQLLVPRVMGGHEAIVRRYGQVSRNSPVPPVGFITPAKPARDASTG